MFVGVAETIVASVFVLWQCDIVQCRFNFMSITSFGDGAPDISTRGKGLSPWEVLPIVTCT